MLTAYPGSMDDFSSTIHVRIRKLHTRTLSCTTVVDIMDRGQLLPLAAFLKLYDHRFADQLRRDNKVKKWTGEVEQAYIQSVRNGALGEFLHNLHNIPSFQENTEGDWTDAQNQAYLADELLKLFKAEVAAHDVLYEQWGKLITNLNITPEVTDLLDFHPFQVKRTLLQCVVGFNLRQVPERCPPLTWQDMVDQAVSIQSLLRDYNILNLDVRPENCIIYLSADGQEAPRYRVFMVDFGNCRIRGKDETDLERGRAKYSKDEEGALGLMMQMILKRDYGFQLHYEKSERCAEWADTDESLPEGTVRRGGAR